MAGDATNDLSKVRPLTTLERARIQTFPASFEFSGSKTDLEQMIGNAVLWIWQNMLPST